MTRLVLLLLSVVALTPSAAHAQIRRGTGLLTHTHGRVLLYTYASRVVVQPAHREEFMRASRTIVVRARQEAGCQSFCCYEDADSPNAFLLTGAWTTSAALQAHRGQPYIVGYFEQLAYWLAEPSRLIFYETIKEQSTPLAATP